MLVQPVGAESRPWGGAMDPVDAPRRRSGFETCERGAEFTKRNVHGEPEWTPHEVVVRLEPASKAA